MFRFSHECVCVVVCVSFVFMGRHTFQEEETVYSNEQIRFEHIHFIDNQPVVDLIESKVRTPPPLSPPSDKLTMPI